MKRVLLRASTMVAVSTVGSSLVLAGVALLFLPGPGLLLIIAGVAVLAREFRWALRLRDWLVGRARDLRTRAQARRITGRIDGSHEDVGVEREDVPAA